MGEDEKWPCRCGSLYEPCLQHEPEYRPCPICGHPEHNHSEHGGCYGRGGGLGKVCDCDGPLQP